MITIPATISRPPYSRWVVKASKPKITEKIDPNMASVIRIKPAGVGLVNFCPKTCKVWAMKEEKIPRIITGTIAARQSIEP